MSFFRESSSARKAMELCGDLLKLRGSSLSLEPSLMLNIADKLEESKIEINHSLKDMKDEDKKSKLSELRLNIIRKTRTNLRKKLFMFQEDQKELVNPYVNIFIKIISILFVISIILKKKQKILKINLIQREKTVVK